MRAREASVSCARRKNVDKQVLDALLLLGLDETVTLHELKRQWRFLSSHTHPDRFKRCTAEYEEALDKQKCLNNAKDCILEFIKDRDQELEIDSVDNKTSTQQEATAEPKEHNYEKKSTKEDQNIQTPTSKTNMETTISDGQKDILREFFTLGLFFGIMFVGVLAAGLVSLLLPFLATSAPVILVAVMLITMAGAFHRVVKLLEKYPQIARTMAGE